LKLTITHHAKVRWFEKFNRIINRIQIEDEIEYNFKRAKLYREQNNDINIYINKNANAYFVTRDRNNERIIITAYPINIENEKLINTTDFNKQTNDILKLNESFEIQVYRKVLDGELNKFPQGFWKDDIGGDVFIGAKECTLYMYRHLLKWNYADIINKSNKNIFTQNKLSGMISTLFNSSWHMAIYNAYPDIKPYMIKNGGNIREYWQENGIERAKEMGVWLTEKLRHKGYKFSSKNILSLRWDRIIKEYKLQSMLTIVFDNNLVKFFNTVFDSNIIEEDIIRYNLKLMERKYEKLQM